LARPGTRSVTLLDVTARTGSDIRLLGSTETLPWSAQGKDLKVNLPPKLPGEYAWVLELEAAS
jgi:hypothetical protein